MNNLPDDCPGIYYSDQDSLAINFFQKDTFVKSYMLEPGTRQRTRHALKYFNEKEEKRKNKVK